jgi:hypothetical protein
MACSVCGLSGHNKTTCARQRAHRIAHVVAKYGASEVLARGLDVLCPGLGLTYQAVTAIMTCVRVFRTAGVNEEVLFEVLMGLN